MSKNIIKLLCVVMVFALLTGCSRNQMSDRNLDSSKNVETNTTNNNVKEFSERVFADNEAFKIIPTKAIIVNNNAEFNLRVENKLNNPIEINLTKISIGNLVKESTFESKLNSNEIKEEVLVIKDISKLEELQDKIHGTFLVNSEEYDFIFKY